MRGVRTAGRCGQRAVGGWICKPLGGLRGGVRQGPSPPFTWLIPRLISRGNNGSKQEQGALRHARNIILIIIRQNPHRCHAHDAQHRHGYTWPRLNSAAPPLRARAPPPSARRVGVAPPSPHTGDGAATPRGQAMARQHYSTAAHTSDSTHARTCGSTRARACDSTAEWTRREVARARALELTAAPACSPLAQRCPPLARGVAGQHEGRWRRRCSCGDRWLGRD